jgi:acetyl-CoA carboxylase biotin carboxyl carrier protein
VDLDFEQLKELIKLVGKSQVTEIKLESQQLKLCLSKTSQQSESQPATVVALPQPIVSAPNPPATQVAAAPQAEGHAAEALMVGPGQEVIVAPMVGTFYRAASPDAEPFIDLGSMVEVGTTVCIIEAMKLMNEIESEVRGRVVRILAENGQAVEYGQPLFVLEH